MKDNINKNLSLAEFDVRTVSNGPSVFFSAQIYGSGAKPKILLGKRGSVTYSRHRENEVSRICFIPPGSNRGRFQFKQTCEFSGL